MYEECLKLEILLILCRFRPDGVQKRDLENIQHQFVQQRKCILGTTKTMILIFTICLTIS